MKFYLIAFFALAVAAQAAFLPGMDPSTSLAKDNIIDNLIRKALEYIRKLMKENEPLLIPNTFLLNQHIVDKGVDLEVNLSNVKVSKASDFVVKTIENDLPHLTAKFGVEIPAVHLEGDYSVSGVVEGKKVEGKGSAVVDLNDFVQNGFIKATITRHEVQMKELDLDYDLKSLHFDLQGLNIEGMSKDQVEALLNQKFFDFLQTNKKDVCDAVAKHVKEQANELMKGKSLKELLDWLKKMIGN